jgi:uncharacterized membrane protein YkoI
MVIFKKFLILGVIGLLLTGLSPISWVEAAPRGRQQSVQQGVSASEAAAIVQRATGGDVLKVERSQWKGSPSYRVRVYFRDKGLVREFHVNASTGQIMD